jgi:hypothetical protein
VGAEALADALGARRAAAEREHRRHRVGERLDGELLLVLAERGLAALREDLRHRGVELVLDLAVEVDEGPPDALGHFRADGRLPGAHEADERDVTI